MAWQRSSDNSLTESLIQSRRYAKFDHQVLTRFHEFNKAKLPSNGRPNPCFQVGTEYEMENWLSEKILLGLSANTNLAWSVLLR